MTFNKEFPEDFQNKTVERLDERFRQLNTLAMDLLDRCVRFLFITNAGGAISIITYMGTAGIEKANGHHKSALVLFVVGVIYSGLLNIFLLRNTDFLYIGWRMDTDKYYSDKLEYDDLFARDYERSKNTEQFYRLGYCAFAFFIFGAIIGLFAFLA